MMDAIETFVVAAHAGSFAGAARRLGKSPALIGRRIQALEEHYGTRLIERTTRSQRLTAAGETFLLRAEALLQAARDLEETARNDSGTLSGRIRFSACVTLGIRRFAPLVAAFQSAHPDVSVEMELSDRRVDIINDGFDFVVRVGDLETSGLVARRIGTYGFSVCASPDWIARNGVPETPQDLANLSCILNLNLQPRNRWPFIGKDGPMNVTVGGGIEIDNGEAQRMAGLAGGGIVYLPTEIVREDLAAGRLIRLLADWPTISMPVYLVRPRRTLVPARVSALMDVLRTGLAD